MFGNRSDTVLSVVSGLILCASVAHAQTAVTQHTFISLPSEPAVSMHFHTSQPQVNFHATGVSFAPNGGAVFSGDSTASGAVYTPNTQIAYVNYADAARAEFLSMTLPGTTPAGTATSPMDYTVHMGSMNATLGMGGGDVQMNQPGLMALTGAAAMAEASLDVTNSSHTFGFRVQGRAMSNQRLFLPTANFEETKLIVSAKPLLTAYWHF